MYNTWNDVIGNDITCSAVNIVNEVWQRFHTEHLVDGTVRELYGKVNGTADHVKVIEYKITPESFYG